MDVRFIDSTGGVADSFQIRKQSGCTDNLDNDGDGFADAQDVQCGPVGALSEFPARGDGIDNDGDGLADGLDPGCWGSGTRESPACEDGIDNDGDGFIDYDGAGGAGAPDPNCTAPWQNRESPQGSACGLGPELSLLLPLIAALRARRGPRRRGRRIGVGALLLCAIVTATASTSADAAVFDVVAFGADPAFAGDDTAAANAAAAAACAAGGGEVHFPAGFYRLGRVHGAGGAFYSGLQVTCSNVVISGMGDSSVLMPANTGGQTVIALCAAFTGIFKDRECDFTNLLFNLIVRDLKIWDDDPLGHCITNPGSSVCLSEESHGITARNVHGLLIARVTLESLGDESVVIGGGSRNAIIRDNVFLDCPSVSSPGSCLELAWGSDYLVANNEFQGGISGSIINLSNHGTGQPIRHVTIENNQIGDPGPLAVGRGIQLAPNLAPISDVAIVNNTLSLDGGPPAIEITTSAFEVVDLQIIGNFIEGFIDLRSVSLRGLDLRDSVLTSSGPQPLPALVVAGEDLEVHNNAFVGHSGSCILVAGLDGATRDVHITGNYCQTNSDSLVSEPAINIADSDCNPNDGVDGVLEIVGNWIQPPPGGSLTAGVGTSDCTNAEISQNTVVAGSSWVKHGIVGGLFVLDNTLSGVALDGIRTGVTGPLIQGNTVQANRCVALDAADSADVWSNDFTLCTGIVETNGATSTSCYDNDGEPAPCSRILDCQDGADNDNDGLIDGADPDCSASPTKEASSSSCGLGPELVPLLGGLALARRRRQRVSVSRSPTSPADPP